MSMHWHELLYFVPAAILAIWIASALYVHFRGIKRHKFTRQLTDHSTFMAPYNSLIYLFSSVSNKPILNIDEFPDLKVLTENWMTIRDEAARLYEAGHIAAAEKHNDLAFNSFFKRGWKRFYLKWYDDFLPSAKEICPKTVALVESIPSVHAALFALLPGNSKLGEHRDPFAGSLRYHLGLITPNSDDCRIFVDGTPYAWRDGQAVLFDETYIHSVKNDTDKDRLILFCDVTRPIGNPVVRWFNNFVIDHIVKITAAQNKTTEKIGVFNRFSRVIFGIKSLSDGFHKKHRKAHKIVNAVLNYTLVAAVIAAVAIWALRHR
ncbi:MAG TPA: aspartyl/asparaginyl beta-hydroxylase domain-containing protein [Tepidisphaeraceae bacterium]|nr:aspartyl/asparaginyl beta-hydroxylase domain-containing protein [Tepidisphaeraceae bacterium]